MVMEDDFNAESIALDSVVSHGTGGDAVVDALTNAGIDVVFGIPAGHNIDLFDSLARNPRIRTVAPRHEQGAGFMADGYARVGRRTGVLACVEGPGIANAMTALGEAFSDSSPVLAISSQIPSAFDGRGLGTIHELASQLDVFRSVTVDSYHATEVGEIPALLQAALSNHHGGKRPGPVHVEIPVDVLGQEGSWQVSVVEAAAPRLPEDDLARAAEKISKGRRPVILAGAGASRGGAERELRRLAELIGAPVLTTALGKGSMDEDHDLYVATTSLWSPWLVTGPVADLIRSADPLVVVGSRLTDATTTDWQMPQPETLIQIDVDAHVSTHHYRPDVSLTGEASAILDALCSLIPPRATALPEQTLSDLRKVPLAHAAKGMGWGFDLVRSLSSVLGTDTVVMGDSLIGLWAATAWHTRLPRRYHIPMHFNTLGFALPSAIGAKLADPSAPVVALAGDGALMFTVAEISTAVQEEVPIIIIVCNDNGYESIRRQQIRRFDGRTIGVDLHSPDFVALARAMGAEAFTINDPSNFPETLERAAAVGRPALIEVPLSVSPPWEV